jgi:hypothetical protein
MKLTPNQRKIVEYARQNDNTITKKQAGQKLAKNQTEMFIPNQTKLI